MKRIFLILFPLFFCVKLFAQKETFQGQSLAGNWVSLEDSNYVLTITKVNIFEKYLTEKGVDTFFYDIGKHPCFNSKEDTIGLYLRKYNKRNKEFYCYRLVRISVDEFVLVYSDNGSMANFKRRVRSSHKSVKYKNI